MSARIDLTFDTFNDPKPSDQTLDDTVNSRTSRFQQSEESLGAQRPSFVEEHLTLIIIGSVMVGLIIIIVIASVLVASKYKLDEEKEEEEDKSTENGDQRLSQQSIQYSKVEKQVLNLLRKDEEHK